MDSLPFFVIVHDKSTLENGQLVATQLYPEVHHVFSDDDFSPTDDALDPNTTAVIVDFDSSGSQIVDFCSLSPDWQVTDVHTDKPVSSELNLGDTVRLFIDGTAATVTDSGPHSSDSIAELRRQFDSLKARNAQLAKLVG